MSEAETDAFQFLTVQIRDLERRYAAVAPAKAAIFAFACTDTSAASRGLVHADATIRRALQAIASLHHGKISDVSAVLDSIGVLYEYYLTQEAAVATKIADPAHMLAAMARVAEITPDFDDALRTIARAVLLQQEVAPRWLASLPPAAIMLICLIWMIFIIAPVAKLKLPPEWQELLTNEPGYIAIGALFVAAVTSYHRRSSRCCGNTTSGCGSGVHPSAPNSGRRGIVCSRRAS